MADVHPLRGWRYDISQSGSLADVTAPPYDVIGPEEQDELYERHPCNVVRLILNREEPGDDSPEARYERAANFLRHWKTEGVLQQERENALYVYHQNFEWDGQTYNRKGFLGRIRLEEFGKGQVFPHEQTMSGPKADRLALTKTCRMNLSPIFGLYPDDAAAAQTPLEEVVAGETPLEVTDSLGVLHRLWPVTDQAVINRVCTVLKEKPIFIADGHHRYETALNYRNWLAEQGTLDENHPANFVLMMFVGMSDPGLAILPTHRLVSGLPNLTRDELTAALQSNLELETIGRGADAARETWELIEADGGQNLLGFGTAADGEWMLGRVTDASVMSKLCPEQSPAWRSLGVSLLHKQVLDHLLKQQFPQAEPQCRYVHLLDEVDAGLSGGEYPLAVLVPPAGIDHVREIASQFEKMPPKSTYFYPKLLSGLVFNPLE